MEVNLITVTAFGLLVGTGVVVVVVRLLTVNKEAVEKSGAYFSELKCTQKYAPGINVMQRPHVYIRRLFSNVHDSNWHLLSSVLASVSKTSEMVTNWNN